METEATAFRTRPASLRDFLVDANHTLGYVIGGQHARPLPRLGGTLRLQAEFAQRTAEWSAWRCYALEARYEFLKLWRMPAYALAA